MRTVSEDTDAMDVVAHSSENEQSSPAMPEAPLLAAPSSAWEEPISEAPPKEFASSDAKERIAQLERKIGELEGLNKALKSQNIQLSTQLRTLRASISKKKSKGKNTKRSSGSKTTSSRRSRIPRVSK